MLKLTFRNADGAVIHRYEWTDTDQDELIIGRDPDRSDLTLESDTVSSTHCRIKRIGEEEFELEDLDSTNGTYLNSEKIDRAVLSEDDRGGVGQFVVDVEFTGTEGAGEDESKGSGERAKELIQQLERQELVKKLLRISAVLLLVGLALFLFYNPGSNTAEQKARKLLNRTVDLNVRHKHEQALEGVHSLLRQYPNTPAASRAQSLKSSISKILERQNKIWSAYRDLVSRYRPSSSAPPSSVQSSLKTFRSKLNVLWNKHKPFLLQHTETEGPFEDAPKMIDLFLQRRIWIEDGSSRSWPRVNKVQLSAAKKYLERRKSSIASLLNEKEFSKALKRARSLQQTFNNSWLKTRVKTTLRKTRERILNEFKLLLKKAEPHEEKGEFQKALNVYRSGKDLFKEVDALEPAISRKMEQTRLLLKSNTNED